jgi:hypothetical protein
MDLEYISKRINNMKNKYRLSTIIFSVALILSISTIYTYNPKAMTIGENLKAKNIYLASKAQEETYYRVIAGSFKDKDNANNRVKEFRI